LNLVLLLVAVAAIGIGVFLLDWVTYDINVRECSRVSRVQRSTSTPVRRR
jgi:hypothetical protein